MDLAYRLLRLAEGQTLHRMDEAFVEGEVRREAFLGPDWGRLEKAAGTDEVLRAEVISAKPDGGLRVRTLGAFAEIAPEEFDEAPKKDLGFLIGTEVVVVVLEADRRTATVRASRRRARDLLARRILPRLNAGDVVEGVVQGVGEFLAYVDLGGVRAVVPASEIDHAYVPDPRKVLSRGDRIRAKVIAVDAGRRRVTLSLRALLPDPWEAAGRTLVAGEHVLGTVTGHTKSGADIFVRLEDAGIIALAPRRTAPEVKTGDRVRAKVNFVDPARRKAGVFVLKVINTA